MYGTTHDRSRRRLSKHAGGRTRRPGARWRGTLGSVVLLLTIVATLVPGHAAAQEQRASSGGDPTVVRTDKGEVRGRIAGDHLVFQGVPYARPPVGRLRFRAPKPSRPWKGVRDATEPGAYCHHTGQYGRQPGREDCLYLNVHVPRHATEPLPVMVFLHGGGFGGGDSALYDPRRVSRQGDVIVVSANYRLSALGFLRHPALRGPWAGNYGMADQQAALRWVRRNIAGFGGDPDNVTLWGESAGAYSVCAQLASPRARGLFDQAVMQSGPCGNDLLTRREAERRGRAAAADLGCADARRVAACLRRVPATRLSQLGADDVRLTRRITDLPWMPVAGTPVIPRQPLRAARTGAGPRVPILLGGTSEEMRTFIIDRYYRGQGLVTDEEYPRLVHDLYGRDARRVLEQYPPARYDTPSDALATLMTDEGRAAGACQLVSYATTAARRSPVFMYEFAEPAPGSVPGFPFGANHGADVPYFFDSYARPGKPRSEEWKALSRTLIRHWTTFARTGRPGSGWTAYEPGQALSFSTTTIGPVDVAARHDCAFWRDVQGM